MTKIIDRTGKGAAISQAEYDANLSSLHGINQSVTGTTFTVDNTDQGDTIECTNTGTCTVTLTAIATINGNIDTDDFKVTILAATASGGVTITRSSTDVIGVDADTSISLVAGQAVTLQTDSTAGVWNIVSGAGYTLGATVANHVRAGNTQILNGNAAGGGTILSVPTTAGAQDTWVVVGPTGTAGTAWTDLDQLPSNATILLVDIELKVTSDASNASCAVDFHATDGDQTSADNLEDNRLAFLTIDSNLSANEASQVSMRIMIPLNSSQEFRMSYDATASFADVDLIYRGFMTN